MININRFSIGGTAAIITSMGLIAGLTQGYNTRTSIITGLLIVAIADNISDSFSIHIYKESEGASRREVSLSTFGNFIARLLTVLTFVFIVLLFPPTPAFIVSSVWGLVLLAMLSYVIAKHKGTRLLREIIWHVMVALIVVICSKLLGTFIVTIIAHS